MKDKVIFRKDKNGEVFAIFPYIIHVGSLVTVFDGSHCGGDYLAMIKTSKPAKPDEYKYLDKILFNFYGYNTKPIKKYHRQKSLKSYYQSQNK